MLSTLPASPSAFLALTLVGLSACAEPAGDGSTASDPASHSYLYVWAGAEVEGESDFLAVVDADPTSERYGEVVASVPVGVRGGAHHTGVHCGAAVRDGGLGRDER